VASGCESRRGRYGTQSARSCDRAGGQVAAWIRWTLPELKRGPAAGNRHGGAPRGAIPVAPGSPRAVNAASRLASVIEDPVCALRRSAAPLVRGRHKKRDDPCAERRAETRGDGTMERARIPGISNGRRATLMLTVTLRCPSEARASKGDGPVCRRESWGRSSFEARCARASG
jgi:hypothetical protein